MNHRNNEPWPNQQQQNNYDLSSNTYNPAWRNHPNLRWTSPPQQQQHVPSFQNAIGPSKLYVPPPIQQIKQRKKIRTRKQEQNIMSIHFYLI